MKNLSMNRNQIKYLVIVAMLIDHIAWAWVPTASTLGQVMHFIGRLTGPTMAYFVAEGYRYTRDVKKYALRLFLFALISWPAFHMFEYNSLPIQFRWGMAQGRGVWLFYIAALDLTVGVFHDFGVIYTLFISLLAIWLWDTKRIPLVLRVIGVAALIWGSQYGDWPYFDVIWALIFFTLKDRPVLKWTGYCLVAGMVYFIFTPWQTDPRAGFFQLGVFMVPLLLTVFYNGEGGSKNRIHKWFFYVFYPAHLLLLTILKNMI